MPEGRKAARSLEIEAKFIVRRPEQVAAALAALQNLGYVVAERAEQQHVDTYFDTHHFAILQEDWAFRHRTGPSTGELTLKSLGEGKDNLFYRDEVTQRLDSGAALPPAGLAAGPVRDVLRPIVGRRRLRPRFTVQTTRRIFDAEMPAGDSRIEIDLDRTTVEACKPPRKTTGRLEFTELELELKAGSAASLTRAARVLADKAGLVPARQSKFERGLQTMGVLLADVLSPMEQKPVGARDPALELVYRFLREQVRVIAANEPLAWEGIDPEGVHKMRVATRRIRSTLKSFSDMLLADAGSALGGELRWLAIELGHARDADVTGMTMDEFRREMPMEISAAVEAYAGYLQSRATGAYDRLYDALSGARYAALKDSLSRFVQSGPSDRTKSAFGDLSVGRAAHRYVRPALRKILAVGDGLQPDSPHEAYHDLRKLGKRVRYLVELFAEAQPARYDVLLRSLHKLQDILGDFQDAVTMSDRIGSYINELPDEVDRELIVSSGRLIQIEQYKIDDCLRRFARAWQPFRQAARKHL